MKVLKAISLGLFLIAACTTGQPASAKDKNEQDISNTFAFSVDKVYVAAVQVASADFNLKNAVREAYTVNFFTGGEFSMVVSAICRDDGNGHTVVTLSMTPAEGNTQVFGLNGTRDKLAKRFWAELESTLSIDQKPDTQATSQTGSANTSVSAEQFADVAVKSTPDSADIMVDGRFYGNTPSTLHLSAGDHKLTIDSKGFQNWERVITISPGEAITVNATLEPEAKPQ